MILSARPVWWVTAVWYQEGRPVGRLVLRVPAGVARNGEEAGDWFYRRFRTHPAFQPGPVETSTRRSARAELAHA